MKRLLPALSRLLISISIVFTFATQAYSEPPNLALLRKDAVVYHDSGMYEKEIQQAISNAKNYIMQQALIKKQENPQKKLALVLDIDETSLSNYSSMVQHDFVVSRAQIYKEFTKANDPAIEATLALYKDAQKHGIDVFFVTGRSEILREATQLNLQRAGYKNWAGIYMKPKDYSKKSIIPFKSKARAEIIAKGYIVLASIGDQYSDFKGGFVQKGFKLPNPYYYLP